MPYSCCKPTRSAAAVANGKPSRDNNVKMPSTAISVTQETPSFAAVAAEHAKINTGMQMGNSNKANNQLDCLKPTTNPKKTEPIP